MELSGIGIDKMELTPCLSHTHTHTVKETTESRKIFELYNAEPHLKYSIILGVIRVFVSLALI